MTITMSIPAHEPTLSDLLAQLWSATDVHKLAEREVSIRQAPDGGPVSVTVAARFAGLQRYVAGRGATVEQAVRDAVGKLKGLVPPGGEGA